MKNSYLYRLSFHCFFIRLPRALRPRFDVSDLKMQLIARKEKSLCQENTIELNFQFFHYRITKRQKYYINNNFSHFLTLMFQRWLFSYLGERPRPGGSTALNYDQSKLYIEKNKKIINESMKINQTKIKGYFCSRAVGLRFSSRSSKISL